MLRRSYAYMSLGFIAIWLLINLSYINKLNTPDHKIAPHLNHDGDEKNELLKDLREKVITDLPEAQNIVTKERIYVGNEISLTADEMLDIENGMERHSFNVTASNAIPLDRDVPSFKPAE
jgi:hypothetical protein